MYPGEAMAEKQHELIEGVYPDGRELQQTTETGREAKQVVIISVEHKGRTPYTVMLSRIFFASRDFLISSFTSESSAAGKLGLHRQPRAISNLIPRYSLTPVGVERASVWESTTKSMQMHCFIQSGPLSYINNTSVAITASIEL